MRCIAKEIGSKIRHLRNVSSTTDHHLYIFLFTAADLDAVARSDPRPPDMRTVAGSILTSGSIFSWSLVMK